MQLVPASRHRASSLASPSRFPCRSHAHKTRVRVRVRVHATARCWAHVTLDGRYKARFAMPDGGAHDSMYAS